MVGGLEHEWYCFSHHIGNFIIPTDELTPSFFRGVGKPPSSNTFFCYFQHVLPSKVMNMMVLHSNMMAFTLW